MHRIRQILATHFTRKDENVYQRSPYALFTAQSAIYKQHNPLVTMKPVIHYR